MIASLARLWRDVRLPRPTASDWDRAYAGGRWDFLWNQAESPRVAMVAHYVRLALPPDAVVLDLGCGEGPLLDAIAPLPFRAYLGVDLSPVAIERAQARATSRSRFAVGDAATFVPDEAPHVIVLNEILYYLPDPEACVRRLLACLRPGGALIVSIYDKRKTRWLWRALAGCTDTVDAVTLTNEEGTRWRVAWLARR